VTCEACEDQQKIDHVTPQCETEAGCPIPPIDGLAERIVIIRNALYWLRDIAGPAVVVEKYQITKDELDILAMVEQKVQAMMPKGNPHGGSCI
jgi:hypothetical protein